MKLHHFDHLIEKDPKVRDVHTGCYFNFWSLSSNFSLWVLTDKFKKEYHTPDMASILKVTSAIRAKPSSNAAKKVRGRMKCLNKDSGEGS